MILVVPPAAVSIYLHLGLRKVVSNNIMVRIIFQRILMGIFRCNRLKAACGSRFFEVLQCIQGGLARFRQHSPNACGAFWDQLPQPEGRWLVPKRG